MQGNNSTGFKANSSHGRMKWKRFDVATFDIDGDGLHVGRSPGELVLFKGLGSDAAKRGPASDEGSEDFQDMTILLYGERPMCKARPSQVLCNRSIDRRDSCGAEGKAAEGTKGG